MRTTKCIYSQFTYIIITYILSPTYLEHFWTIIRNCSSSIYKKISSSL